MSKAVTPNNDDGERLVDPISVQQYLEVFLFFFYSSINGIRARARVCACVCMYVCMYVFLLILWSNAMLKKTAEKYRVQGNGLFSKKNFKSAFKFYQDAEQVCLYYPSVKFRTLDIHRFQNIYLTIQNAKIGKLMCYGIESQTLQGIKPIQNYKHELTLKILKPRVSINYCME